MSDLNNDIRLVVDTGKISFGSKSTVRAMSENAALAIIIAEKGKNEIITDITHLCGISKMKLIKFDGNPVELGALCGKPYSVNALAIMDPGSSNILKEEYGV